MNGEEMKKALSDIALSKAREFEDKLKVLDKSAVNERKALMIGKQMAKNCANMVTIDFKERFYGVRQMRVYGEDFHDFDEYKPLYETLSGSDKESFLIFSFCMVMVKHDFKKPSVENEQFAADYSERDVQRAFAEKIKAGVKREILLAWQKFWNENGCIKCEVYK